MTDVLTGIVMQADEWTPDHAASYVTEAWQKAVDSIVETGRRLSEAKQRLGHGNWLPMVALLPFSEQTAQKLMAISRHPDIANPAHGRDLPASWTTLYVLTQLPPGEIPRRIEAHEINAELKREAAQAFVSTYAVARQEALNAYSNALDGLTTALSYAKTYSPPDDIPEEYPSISEFTGRTQELLDIAQEWEQ